MKLKDILNESSLTRIYQHMSEHDTGVVTAFRYAPDCGKGKPYVRKENLQRNKLLLAKIFSKGYNVVALRGAYIENFGTKDAREVNENTFFVVDIKDAGNLLSDLKLLGEEFEQDSILFVPKGGLGAELHGTNHCPNSYPGYGNIIKYNTRQLGKDGEFFSRVKNRPFSFIPESVMNEIFAPQGFFGRWGCSTAAKQTWQEMQVDENES